MALFEALFDGGQQGFREDISPSQYACRIE